MKRIAVIGGGASGMMAAIIAARNGCAVTIYEQNNRVGKKLLATGNGRCNYGNRNRTNAHYYCGTKEEERSQFLNAIFGQHDVSDTEAFFTSLGLCTHDRDGYLYPVTDQASTILEVLLLELERLGVIIKTEVVITSIQSLQRKYHAVIVACGSNATSQINGMTNGAALAKELGHTIVPILPSLVQLRTQIPYAKAMSGVRSQVEVTLFVNGSCMRREVGELQHTEYGLSGIVVFQLSREIAIALHKKENACVSINYLPYLEERAIREVVMKRYEIHRDSYMDTFLLGMVHKKLIQPLLQMIHVPKSKRVNEYTIEELCHIIGLLQKVTMEICDTNPIEKAQVCSGGVSIGELGSDLSSKLTSNVYFVGEMVDVDGMCGGYNLQWAWSSGYVAGYKSSKHNDM